MEGARKRKAVTENDEGDKRFRLEIDSSAVVDNSVDDSDMATLVQDLLVVPYEYLFREVPSSSLSAAATNPTSPDGIGGQRRKHLLSRSEAHCLIQVNLLAHEMDSLAHVTNQTFQQSLYCRDFGALIHQSGRHPFLRPLLPILSSLEHGVTNATLSKIATALDQKIVPALRRNVEQLQQYSEQNWTLFETLVDSESGAVSLLADEKRKLSEVQEELCQRIESLLQDHESGGKPKEPSSSPVNPESMHDFCQRIFQDSVATSELPVEKDAERPGEVWDEPAHATTLSAVSSPPTSPAPRARRGAATSKVGARTAPRRIDRTEDILTSDLLFAPHRLMESSKKRDEKETASSQPSSQHSSQARSPMVHESSVLETMALSPSRKMASAASKSALELAAAESDTEDEATPAFQSQGAAHVLSTMASLSSLRTGGTRGETPLGSFK